MKIAYIGFGEAAYNIVKGWRTEGLRNIVAFDTNKDDHVKGELINRRAAEAGVTLANDVEEAYCDADFIFNNTSASCALAIAQNVLPNLKPGQTYLDLNATSPAMKSRMAQVPHAEGVNFIDVAVMGAVPKKGHKTKMYISGEGVHEFCEVFTKYGMDLHPLDAQAGGASAIKMFKSVFSKGLPQLLLESMLPAAKYGVLDEFMSNINKSFVNRTMEEYADMVLVRTVIHAERRSHELHEVIATLEGMEMDASMSKATLERLQQLVKKGIPSEIPGDAEMGYRDVIDLILKKTEGK